MNDQQHGYMLKDCQEIFNGKWAQCYILAPCGEIADSMKAEKIECSNHRVLWRDPRKSHQNGNMTWAFTRRDCVSMKRCYSLWPWPSFSCKLSPNEDPTGRALKGPFGTAKAVVSGTTKCDMEALCCLFSLNERQPPFICLTGTWAGINLVDLSKE